MEYKLTFEKYNEALKANKLLGLKCLDCGAITTPPKMVCGTCGSLNLDIIELAGNGKIETFTTIFVVPEGREAESPYVLVMVGLDEGPWIMGNLTGIQPDSASMDLIGKKVKMTAVEVFPGDKYSAGDGARPLFSIVE